MYHGVFGCGDYSVLFIFKHKEKGKSSSSASRTKRNHSLKSTLLILGALPQGAANAGRFRKCPKRIPQCCRQKGLWYCGVSFQCKTVIFPSQTTKPCLCHSHLNLRDSQNQKCKKKDASKDFVISVLLVT